jgi:hypothetical protein
VPLRARLLRLIEEQARHPWLKLLLLFMQTMFSTWVAVLAIY